MRLCQFFFLPVCTFSLHEARAIIVTIFSLSFHTYPNQSSSSIQVASARAHTSATRTKKIRFFFEIFAYSARLSKEMRKSCRQDRERKKLEIRRVWLNGRETLLETRYEQRRTEQNAHLPHQNGIIQSSSFFPSLLSKSSTTEGEKDGKRQRHDDETLACTTHSHAHKLRYRYTLFFLLFSDISDFN